MIERRFTGLRARVRNGPATGIFVKTPAPQNVELLGMAGVDFVAIDAEHAPFDRGDIDAMAMAARATSVPLLLRVAGLDAAVIGGALDSGVDGIIVPHVRSAAEARAAVEAVRFAAGTRGFSPSVRAAGYGTQAAGFAEASDARTSLWCQIEDAEALDCLDEIAAVDGIDCLFVGPVDLARSLGTRGGRTAAVEHHYARIVAAARGAGLVAGIFVGSTGMIASTVALGFDVVICGSDQSALLAYGQSLKSRYAG